MPDSGLNHGHRFTPPVCIVVTREQMPELKKLGWVVVGTHGGGGYVMEAPRG